MNYLKGGGNWTSFCPICGLHFYIQTSEIEDMKDYYDEKKYTIDKKKTKIEWSKKRDKILSNFDKLKNLKKITFSEYNKITLLLPNSKVKHKVKYEYNNDFINYGEVYFNTPIYTYDGTKGLPMHTECWNLAKNKFNHEFKLEDFLYNKNIKEGELTYYLFNSINYGITTKYATQDWDDNFWNIDSNAFLLNDKDWYILYLPSGKSDEAKKNSKRIEKISEKIIKGIIKSPKKLTSKKLNNDRPSPAKSATLFKEGNKKREMMEICIL